MALSSSPIKVGFSLAPAKKKKKKSEKITIGDPASSSDERKKKRNVRDEFASEDEDDAKRREAREEYERRKGTLVIPLIPAPLPPSKPKVSIEDENEEDAEARRSLIASATGGGETGSSSANDAAIPLTGGGGGVRDQPLLAAARLVEGEDDATRYRRDLDLRADDMAVTSTAYVSTPVVEFGAAMLRGMGWKGEVSDKEKEDSIARPRRHRLGLGAVPKLTDKDVLETHRRGGKNSDATTKNRPSAKPKTKEPVDLQTSLQIGTIVVEIGEEKEHDTAKTKCENRRAVVIKAMGVPGLDRVLIQYEKEIDMVSINKRRLVLVDKKSLENRPFVRATEPKQKKEEVKKMEVKVEDVKQEKEGTPAPAVIKSEEPKPDSVKSSSSLVAVEREEKQPRNDTIEPKSDLLNVPSPSSSVTREKRALTERSRERERQADKERRRRSPDRYHRQRRYSPDSSRRRRSPDSPRRQRSRSRDRDRKRRRDEGFDRSTRSRSRDCERRLRRDGHGRDRRRRRDDEDENSVRNRSRSRDRERRRRREDDGRNRDRNYHRREKESRDRRRDDDRRDNVRKRRSYSPSSSASRK